MSVYEFEFKVITHIETILTTMIRVLIWSGMLLLGYFVHTCSAIWWLFYCLPVMIKLECLYREDVNGRVGKLLKVLAVATLSTIVFALDQSFIVTMITVSSEIYTMTITSSTDWLSHIWQSFDQCDYTSRRDYYLYPWQGNIEWKGMDRYDCVLIVIWWNTYVVLFFAWRKRRANAVNKLTMCKFDLSDIQDDLWLLVFIDF